MTNPLHDASYPIVVWLSYFLDRGEQVGNLNMDAVQALKTLWEQEAGYTLPRYDRVYDEGMTALNQEGAS